MAKKKIPKKKAAKPAAKQKKRQRPKPKPATPVRHDAALPSSLTWLQTDAFFKAIKKAGSTRDYAMFRLIYHRGLRACEPGRLKIEDYNPEEGRLLVHRAKGSVSAEYRLCDLERTALRAWLRDRGTAPGPLFRSRNHRPISRDRVGELMSIYSAVAGIPRAKAHPHALKHTCGAHVAELLDGNILRVQEHLGHKDVRSTMVYIRLVDREQVADKLSTWGKKK